MNGKVTRRTTTTKHTIQKPATMALPLPLPLPWLVLHKDTFASADQGEGFSILCGLPPIISRLVVSDTQRQADGNPPRVVAAGLFLLPCPTGNYHSRGYTVLAAANRNFTYRVPSPTAAYSFRAITSSVGVIGGAGGSFKVVMFENGNQMWESQSKSLLHCYCQGAGGWTTKEVRNEYTDDTVMLFGDVIAHDGRIWWLSKGITAGSSASGLYSCDPFADKPEMLFSTSPEIRGNCSHIDCSIAVVPHDARRCVQVAGGKLRWVQILCRHTEESEPSPLSSSSTLTMLTLDHPTAQWTGRHDYRMALDDIWGRDIYTAQTPALAYIDPNDPSVVVFSVGEYFVGVDMRAKELRPRLPHGMPIDSNVGSTSLLAGVLPPALRPPPPKPQQEISYFKDKIGLQMKKAKESFEELRNSMKRTEEMNKREISMEARIMVQRDEASSKRQKVAEESNEATNMVPSTSTTVNFS